MELSEIRTKINDVDDELLRLWNAPCNAPYLTK